jgi:drug/metabolite transporter (DMT)-like permease
MFGLATILWFDLLSRMELSLLYPFMSLSYVIAFFAGWFFLGENPQPLRLVGIVIIILGIALVARSSP